MSLPFCFKVQNTVPALSACCTDATGAEEAGEEEEEDVIEEDEDPVPHLDAGKPIDVRSCQMSNQSSVDVATILCSMQCVEERCELDATLKQQLDDLIQSAWLSGSEDTLYSLLKLMVIENVSG
jgi:hypothetical protein